VKFDARPAVPQRYGPPLLSGRGPGGTSQHHTQAHVRQFPFPGPGQLGRGEPQRHVATLAQRGLLSVEATAEALSVSEPTLYRMISDDRIAAVHHGGQSWVEQAEIDNYFARLRAEGAKLARAQRSASKGKRVG
jgi:excisionase family DNA binding protein